MSIKKLSLVVVGGLILVAVVMPVEAQKPDHHEHARIQPVAIPKLTIPDVEVLDQEGSKGSTRISSKTRS